MGDAEELARKEPRRRLIERLNEQEKLMSPPRPGRGGQMGEPELGAEIQQENGQNAAGQGGFSF